MMPKSRHGFLGDIMLYLIGTDHVHVFSSIRAKDIVIYRPSVGLVVRIIDGKRDLPGLLGSDPQ